MLTSNYITSRLQGRTGNLMFQIANGFVRSIIYNRQFTIPSHEAATNHLQNNLFRKLTFLIEKIPDTSTSKHIWSSFPYSNVQPPSNDQPTVYAGWYQSEKFFEGYKEQVKDLFSPTDEFHVKVYNELPFMKDSKVAAINIRRGDYLTQPTRHPVITLDYIYEAYKLLPTHDYLLIMSDDIDWCKENINLPKSLFVDPSKFWEHDGLWLLSLCSYFVISNSTFSWWGAWLSNAKDKVVISPSTWFGPDVIEDPKDIWCDSWIKYPTYYDDGLIKIRK